MMLHYCTLPRRKKTVACEVEICKSRLFTCSGSIGYQGFVFLFTHITCDITNGIANKLSVYST